ncbi:MAG TPA: hypothetical protein VFI25_03730 [Planctomycetota bacterium]|nr:hypothetical protein [Planctomycetota bacterium]
MPVGTHVAVHSPLGSPRDGTLGFAVLLATVLLPAWGRAQVAGPPKPPPFAGHGPIELDWWRAHGGQMVRAQDPTRPAILLFHGLHRTAECWTSPSRDGGYNFDYGHPPATVTATKDAPGVGVFKVGKSDLLGVDSQNWFDFLVQRGFTVATFSQGGPRLEQAVPTALEALERFARETAAHSPSAPPPIALLGHSRGGLVIRKVLKEKGDLGRVRWAITLHSPHAGSELARTPGRLAAEIVDAIDAAAPPVLTAPLKKEIKDLVVELARPLTRWIVDDESRELMPDSPFLRDLAAGERELPGVRYHSFGGTKPTLFRLYAWVFTPESAVPQYRAEGLSVKQYFKWEAKPQELTLISPMLEKVRDFAPEIKPGYGDTLVTDRSARFPFPSATHETDSLNHAEVLWDRRLQERVSGLLASGLAPRPNLPTRFPLR